MPPPTQGLASLMILAIFDRLGVETGESFEHIHGLIESTKQAFIVRDSEVRSAVHVHAARAFPNRRRFGCACRCNRPSKGAHGLTWLSLVTPSGWCRRPKRRHCKLHSEHLLRVWLGRRTRDTGINWQNRGASFSLDEAATNALKPVVNRSTL